MNPALAVEAFTTASVIAGVTAMVVRGNGGLERARLAHNQHAGDLRAATQHTRTTTGAGRRPRRAVSAAPASRVSRVLPAAAAGRSLPSGQAGGAGRVPPVDTPVRLDDGRTGRVSTTERIPRATRVYLDLDDGGRGHVDVPDLPDLPNVRPTPAPLPQPQPQAKPQPQVQAPQALAAVRPVRAPRKVFVVPATPAPAAVTGSSSASVVRLGGFTMPASPTTALSTADMMGGGRS